MNSVEQREAFEALASLQYGEPAVSEIIRPAAVLPEMAARAVLTELMHRDVRAEGSWLADPSLWRRYDGPFGTVYSTNITPAAKRSE